MSALDTLRTYVGVGDDEYDSLLQECLDEAIILVDKYAGGSTSPIPPVVLNRCYTEVAADLFDRRNAPNGVRTEQYGLDGGVTTRINRDPLAGVYKTLNRWVTPW